MTSSAVPSPRDFEDLIPAVKNIVSQNWSADCLHFMRIPSLVQCLALEGEAVANLAPSDDPSCRVE